ncbi:MAG: ABC transporter substrate-binding protein [Clostridiales bacterium]|nr:ABC transporter substrate-binding protein [Clostridiales bacterium]
MKKSLILIGILIISIMMVIGCSNDTNNAVDNSVINAENASVEETNDETTNEEAVETPVERPELRIATLKGPTGIGMVQMMENDELETSAVDYTFDLVGAPDQIIGKVVQGEVEIAAVPTNLASILNVKTEGQIQLLAVNTLGVLYVLENGQEIQSIEDLKGKTLRSSGKGASPEYILNYVLAENGLTDDVTVEYAVEHSELATTTTAGDTTLALLPQPFVTSTLLGNADVRIALDLTKEWEKVTGGSVLPMGAIIVNKAYAEANPEVIASFMAEYQASVEFVNASPVDAGLLVEKFGILPKAALATKAIPNCNITLIDAQTSKESVMKFYEILKGYDPKSIGGSMPEDSFFYEKK